MNAHSEGPKSTLAEGISLKSDGRYCIQFEGCHLNLSNTSKRRLTIAKQLYSHGYGHSMKKSPSDAILSILNFDYCVEIIMKAVLLDANLSLRKRSGQPKYFDDIMKDLRALCPDLGYTSEVLSLHKLRNDVQHHSLIPSYEEVRRHLITVRSFFDEVCLKAYDGVISFADISLALFIGSEIERMVLAEMERALKERKYPDSLFYTKQAVAYHIRLLRENMLVPRGWHSSFLHHDLSFSRFRTLHVDRELVEEFRRFDEKFEKLGRFVEETDEKLDWILDRLCLREHYDEVSRFLGHIPSRYWIGLYEMERTPADRHDAERARSFAYDFMIRTQDLISKPDLEAPFIFDLLILDKRENECTIQIGLSSASRIIEAKLVLKEQNVEKHAQDISTEIGLQTARLKDLEGGKIYNLFVSAKNEKEETAHQTLSFKMD